MFNREDLVLGPTDAEYKIRIGERVDSCGDGCCSWSYTTGLLWQTAGNQLIADDELEGSSMSAEVVQMMVDQGKLRGLDLRQSNTAIYVGQYESWMVSDILRYPPQF